MKRAAIALLLLACAKLATAAEIPLTLESRSSMQLQVAGATAAYAVDPLIADAAVNGGITTLFGRGPGRTNVVVVTMAGQQVYAVTVTRRPSPATMQSSNSSNNGATVGAAYSSSSRELQSSVALRSGSGKRRTELLVENVTSIKQTSGRDRVSTPSLSWTVTSPGRSLTLFDQQTFISPLTVSDVGVRGVHYDDRKWSLHAGVTSYAAFRSFLLPTDRDLVASASRKLHLFGAEITPTVLATDSGPGRGFRTLASVASTWTRGEHLQASAELAYGGGAAAAGSFSYRSNGTQFAVDALVRPKGVTSIGPAAAHGTFVNAAAAFQQGRVEATVRGSLSHYDEIYTQQSIDTLSADFRYRLASQATLIAGGNLGAFRDRETIRSYSVPLGIELHRGSASFTVLPRYSFDSSSNDGGLGLRVAARATVGRVSSSAYIDVQQYAPTLSIVYRDQPELQAALEELGIVATTPADIARALRENATLASLGFVENVTIELAPKRTLAGWEAGWTGRTNARRQLRLRTFLSQVEGVSRDTNTLGATLSWSQRVTSDFDIFASISDLRIARTGQETQDLPSFQLGFRKSFADGAAFDFRGGSVAGTVFLDDEITGDLTRGLPLAGAEVSLDGEAKVTTRADGRFEFKGVRKTTHRVSVQTPGMPDAYFTTPSTSAATPGDTVNFGVSRTPARLFGRVTSDARDAVANVRLTLRREGGEFTATTDSNGSFTFAVPPGEWEVAISVESLPAGYSIEAIRAHHLTLERNKPTELNFTVKANRSISGRVLTASLPATVTVEPGGRVVQTAADGAYSLRNLPAGRITLRVASANQTWERAIEVPEQPAVIRSVDFGSAPGATHPLQAAVTNGGLITSDHGSVVVQLGAYHVEENATTTVAKARAAGVVAKLVRTGSLTLVRVGPFPSSSEATATISQLRHAGIEAMVVRVR